MHDNEFYLGWCDPDPKKPVARKVREAIQAFERRFKRSPAEVLMPTAELIELDGIDTRAVSYLRPGNYWVGPIESELAQPQMRLAA